MSEPVTDPVRDERVEWQRLDPRMLLVHPLRELFRFLPALAGLFVAGAASDTVDVRWQLLGVLVPVGLGLARYLTTSFRITGDRVELRRGLLDRHLLSTRVDRVRTVDLTSSPVQRLLGLTTVRIGTGTASTSDEDRVDLDGLPAARARALRQDLLRGVPSDGGQDDGAPAPPVQPLLVLDPAWARFAPVTSTGILLAGAVIGAGTQLADAFGGLVGDLDSLPRLPGLLLLAPLLLLVAVVVVTVLAVGGYLVTNWGFTLTHDHGSWHLTRGLLTTRETSLDHERIAGVAVGEPLGLRLAGAARLSAIVTGLDRSQQGSSVLVPPAPRAVVHGVAGQVLGTTEPLTVALVTHGPAAVRRRWTRALLPAVVLAAALVLTVALAGVGRWVLVLAALVLVAAVGLAHDRADGLGHALVGRHLVARSGSLLRQRQVLDVDDVIGWTFRATWFQRRLGLTTLVATTAGGPQAVTVLDVPDSLAVGLADRARPGLVGQFRA